MVIINAVYPPFHEMDVNTFLSIYDNTVKHFLQLGLTTPKKAKFHSLMVYYGMHSTAPIKVYYNEGIFDMAKKYGNTEFVECPLTAEDEPAVEKFVATFKGQLSNLYVDLLGDNYKVEIGFYEDSESYAAFLKPIGEDHKNSGKMLSAWSDDPIEVQFLVAYKHKIKFEGGVWKSSGKKRRWG